MDPPELPTGDDLLESALARRVLPAEETRCGVELDDDKIRRDAGEETGAMLDDVLPVDDELVDDELVDDELDDDEPCCEAVEEIP